KHQGQDKSEDTFHRVNLLLGLMTTNYVTPTDSFPPLHFFAISGMSAKSNQEQGYSALHCSRHPWAVHRPLRRSAAQDQARGRLRLLRSPRWCPPARLPLRRLLPAERYRRHPPSGASAQREEPIDKTRRRKGPAGA